MDSKADEGIFLEYSTNNRAYHVYNTQIRYVIESINVVIDDATNPSVPSVDDEENSSIHSLVKTNVPNTHSDMFDMFPEAIWKPIN